MPIHVTCPGCKKRFTVSERFAGQQGPCPNCKTVLTIPAKEDEVVIHAPETVGPKDTRGQAVLRPILREETRFSLQWTLAIVGAVLGAFVLALLARGISPTMPGLVAALGAILLAPPLVWAGYSFLRDSELEPFRGNELLIRVAGCSAAYAALWGAYAYVQWQLLSPEPEIWQYVVMGVGAVLAGGFAAFASFDLDYLVGMVHYGLYLIATVVLGFVANLDVF